MAKKIPNRDHFLKKPRKVTMTEVDGDPIGVLVMSVGELSAWQKQSKDLGPEQTVGCLLAHTLCNEAGVRIFADEDYGFFAANWTAETIAAASNVAIEINGLMKAQADKATDAKNSEATPANS